MPAVLDAEVASDAAAASAAVASVSSVWQPDNLAVTEEQSMSAAAVAVGTAAVWSVAVAAGNSVVA